MTKCTTHTKLRVHFTLLSGIVSCGAVVAFGSGLSNTSATRAEEVAPITAGSDDSAIELPSVGSRLSDDQVAALMQLVLNGIDREYPNKPSNVMIGPESVQSPQQMHPAFFGCFDWHSSVHGHWVLVRLMKEYPELPVAEVARKRLAEHLTQANLQVEADYFLPKDNKSFERMYGWAWALRLVAELHTWDDPDGRQWRDNIRPLESVLVELTRGYLPRLTWPIRTGVHPDTGFALGQILDYARIVGNVALEQAICQKARDFYGSDKNYISSFEPSGEDFFSTSLNEADLMRRVLTQNEFSEWLENFFPTLNRGELGNLLTAVKVSDVTDGKLVHLAGLNLSRGWTQLAIGNALPEGDARRAILLTSAREHGQAGFRYVFSGHYEGEHWLATFAVYLLTQQNH